MGRRMVPGQMSFGVDGAQVFADALSPFVYGLRSLLGGLPRESAGVRIHGVAELRRFLVGWRQGRTICVKNKMAVAGGVKEASSSFLKKRTKKLLLLTVVQALWFGDQARVLVQRGSKSFLVLFFKKELLAYL